MSGSVKNTKWPLTRAAPRGLTNLCTHHEWDSIACLIRRFFIPVMVVLHFLPLGPQSALTLAYALTRLFVKQGKQMDGEMLWDCVR